MRRKTGTAWAMASLFLLWHTQGLCQETEWEEFLQAEGRIFHGDYTFECEAKDEPPRRSDKGNHR